MFFYYTLEGDHWKINEGKNIISVDGNYDKEIDTETVFTIKDPFDKPHNPGRAKVAKKDGYIKHFIFGHDALNELQNKSRKEERIKLLSIMFEKNA